MTRLALPFLSFAILVPSFSAPPNIDRLAARGMRLTRTQHFKNAGYCSARVSKVFTS